jgi:Rha family phage regulatory protein
MNDIISIENKEGTLVVSSREIAEHFEKEHDKVRRDIKNLRESQPTKLGSDFFIESTYLSDRGRNYPEYLLTRDGFSLLVMGFTGKKALEWKLKYIDAFNKMESALKNQNSLALPTTYKEALKQLLNQVEENEKLIEENNTLKPKANYHDEVLKKTNLISTSIIAKDIGFSSATKLNQLMFENKIIFREGGVWKPYANYEWLMTDCYADYESYDAPNSQPLLKWTEKGRMWIIENYETWLTNKSE